MTFLSATSLFWLIPVIGTIILLYLMKMRRKDMRVPATFLWPRMTSDVRANAPFQKLRFSLLLLLQLLLATLLILALAGPLRRVRGLAGTAMVIVLDNSAAMSATDVSPTRYGEALRRIGNIVGAMRDGDRLALINAGATTRIVFPLTSDKAAMTRAVRTLAPSDANGDMGEALRLAAALVAGRSKARIVVLSDGCFRPIADFSPGKAALEYEAIGTSYKNVAVTAFDSSLAPNGALQCFASIRNYDSSSLPVTVSFKVDGQIVDARQVTIPAGDPVAQTVTVPRGALKAEVEADTSGDILPSDNHATIFLKGAGTVSTLLVSNGNLFLERALSLNPAIRLERATSVPDNARDGSAGKNPYDLVVFDNLPPVPVKAPAVMSFGQPGGQFGVTDSGIAPHPNVVDWARDNPLTRYADFRGIQIDRAHVVKTVPGSDARVAVTGNVGPLVVTARVGGHRTVYTAFNILDSDFPLQVSFPVFAANCVDWLTGGSEGARQRGSGIMVHPGKTFTVSVPSGDATLVRPDGSRNRLVASSGMASVRGLDQVGLYRIEGGATETVAVNVLDSQASDVRPRASLDVSGTHVAPSNSQGTSLSEMWRPILVAALLLMCVEWWVFVRRS